MDTNDIAHVCMTGADMKPPPPPPLGRPKPSKLRPMPVDKFSPPGGTTPDDQAGPDCELFSHTLCLKVADYPLWVDQQVLQVDYIIIQIITDKLKCSQVR